MQPSSAASALNRRLRRAAADNDTGAIRACVAQGADIDEAGLWIKPPETCDEHTHRCHYYNAATALQIACHHEHLDSVHVLLELGADVEAPHGGSGGLALAFAAETNNVALVAALIAHGANCNAIAPGGMTAAMYASMHDAVDTLQVLVQSGDANVNATARNGGDALLCAAKYDACRCGHFLLMHGANVAVGDENIVSATACLGQVRFMQMLLAHDRHGVVAMASTKPSLMRATPFREAVLQKHSDVVRTLLEAGVDPSAPAHCEGVLWGILEVAVHLCDVHTVRVLLDGGVKPQFVDLCRAIETNDECDIVDVLLEHDVPTRGPHRVPNGYELSLSTALNRAMFMFEQHPHRRPHSVRFVETLLRHGVKTSEQHFQCEPTVLANVAHIACKQGVAVCKDIAVALLRDRTLSADDLGREPMFVAMLHEILAAEPNAIDDVLLERCRNGDEGVIIAALRRPCDVYTQTWLAMNDKLYDPDDGDGGSAAGAGGGIVFQEAREHWSELCTAAKRRNVVVVVDEGADVQSGESGGGGAASAKKTRR